MNEDRMDEALRRLAQDYHRPPEPPREEMWAAIRRELPAPGRRPSVAPGRRPAADGRRPVWRPWTGWATGIAAALAVGIGLGRLSVRPGEVAVAPVPEAAAPAPSDVAYRVVTTQHLSQAEALLTSFRSDAASGRPDAQLSEWAGDLLSTTRLLLDSPAAEEPRMRVLLEDLELILAQISRLSPGGAPGAPPGEVEIVRRALDEGGVLPKLRTAIPAGLPLAATEEE